MIGKGNPHKDGAKLADYLLRGEPGERAQLLDMRGFATGDLRQEFADIDKVRDAATKADAALFHVQFRSVAGEGKRLTNAQWLEILDGCDRALGRAMTQQPRAASLHIDEATGDRHLHGAYSLLRQTDDGRFYVERLGKYERKLQLYAREVEKKYGLQIVTNERKPGARHAERREYEESRRLGTDIHEIRTAILQAFNRSDNGPSFDAAMKEQNWIVAAGDRRDCFVVIDHAGGKHALNKGLIGLTLKEIDARLSGLDRAQLPSVDQAQQMQRDRQATREPAQARELAKGAGLSLTALSPSQAPEKGQQPEIKPLGVTAGEVRTAWTITRHRGADELHEEFERRGLILVHVSRDEAAQSYRSRDFAKAIKRQNRALKEGFAVVDGRGNVTRIDQRATGDLWAEIEKRLGAIDRDELLTVAQAREVQRDARKIEFAERKQAERDAARPITDTEQKILDAAATAGRDREKFAAELDYAGIGLARVTSTDVKALDALRQDAELARMMAAATGDEKPRSPRLDDVREGELAAVMKDGSVVRLNQQHMARLEYGNFPAPDAGTSRTEKGDSEVADPSGKRTTAHPSETGNFKAGGIGPLPSIIELRAKFEIERDEAAKFQQGMIDIQLQRATDTTAERLAAIQNRADAQEIRHVVHSVEDAAMLPIAGAGDVIDKGMHAAHKLTDMVLKPFAGLVEALGNLLASPSKPTEIEAEIAPKVAAEKAQTAADVAAYQQNEAARGEEITRKDEQSQQPLTAPEYFRNLRQPGPDPGRERERDRELE
jgi:hypothetical protein